MNFTKARINTNRLISMCNEGLVNKDELIINLLGWLSESEVLEFAERNGYFDDDESEE